MRFRRGPGGGHFSDTDSARAAWATHAAGRIRSCAPAQNPGGSGRPLCRLSDRLALTAAGDCFRRIAIAYRLSPGLLRLGERESGARGDDR